MPLIPPNVTTTIYLLKNGDVRRAPLKFVVNWLCYRSMEVLFNAITEKLNLFSAARRIYTTQGQLISNVTELVFGESYVVCCGYEVFKMMKYGEAGVALSSNRLNNSRSNRNLDSDHYYDQNNSSSAVPVPPRKKSSMKKGRGAWQRTNVISSTINNNRVTPFFTPFMKAYRIVVFPNGDANHRGVHLTLNYRNCRTWDQLMNEVSRCLSFYPVPIRKLYNGLSGQSIEKWADLFDGMNIIAGGSEPLVWKDYKVIGREDLDKMHKVHNPVLETEPFVITVFPNGDSYYMGFNVTVNARFPTIEKLLHYINRHVDWSLTAAGKKLYRIPGGVRIREISELAHGGQYVVTTDTDPLMCIDYNVKALLPVYKMFGNSGSAGSGLRTRDAELETEKYASEGDFNRGLRVHRRGTRDSSNSIDSKKKGAGKRYSTMSSLPSESDGVVVYNNGFDGSGSGSNGRSKKASPSKGTKLGNGSSVSGPKFMPLPGYGIDSSRKASNVGSQDRGRDEDGDEIVEEDLEISASLDKVFGPRQDLNLWLKSDTKTGSNGKDSTGKDINSKKVQPPAINAKTGAKTKAIPTGKGKHQPKYTDDSDDEESVRGGKPNYHQQHQQQKAEKRSDESLDDLEDEAVERPKPPPAKIVIQPKKAAEPAIDLRKLLESKAPPAISKPAEEKKSVPNESKKAPEGPEPSKKMSAFKPFDEVKTSSESSKKSAEKLVNTPKPSEDVKTVSSESAKKSAEKLASLSKPSEDVKAVSSESAKKSAEKLASLSKPSEDIKTTESAKKSAEKLASLSKPSEEIKAPVSNSAEKLTSKPVAKSAEKLAFPSKPVEPLEQSKKSVEEISGTDTKPMTAKNDLQAYSKAPESSEDERLVLSASTKSIKGLGTNLESSGPLRTGSSGNISRNVNQLSSSLPATAPTFASNPPANAEEIAVTGSRKDIFAASRTSVSESEVSKEQDLIQPIASDVSSYNGGRESFEQ